LSERQAEDLLEELLVASGWSVSRQVRLGGKTVDMVATDATQACAIELKVRDWRRAASQAFLNAPYYDASFVALPRNPNRRVDHQLFAELGLGLIEFDSAGWTAILAPPSWNLPAA
jgi:hypothetical protein